MLYLVEAQNLGPVEYSQLDFSMMINRVFLEVYKEPWQFWAEIGRVFETYDKLTGGNPNNDQGILSSRMRELTAFEF